MPEPKKNPYQLATQRAVKERGDVIRNAGQSLAQSGADMTDRLTKNGAVGFPLAVGKEIVGGLKQGIVDPLNSFANQADKAMDAQVGAKSDIDTDKALPFLIGSEPAKQYIAERDKPVIADPLETQSIVSPQEPQKTQSIGINGVITGSADRSRPATAHKNAYEDLRNPSNSMETFVAAGNKNILARGDEGRRDFNDGNYTPDVIRHSGITDPNANSSSPQQQLKQMQLAQLQQDASMAIDNSLPYDVRKTMSGKRDAAQKTLGIMMPSNTADKNRASNYEASQNKSILAEQNRVAKAEEAKNKEGGYFNADEIEYLPDISTDVRLKAIAIPKSLGTEFSRMVANLGAKERADAIRNKRFEGMFGLDADSIAQIFKLNDAEAET